MLVIGRYRDLFTLIVYLHRGRCVEKFRDLDPNAVFLLVPRPMGLILVRAKRLVQLDGKVSI